MAVHDDQRRLMVLAEHTGRRGAGFTLIELLVVVAIIALLISILLPSLSRAREDSKRVVCAQNLKSISTAAKTYAHDHWSLHKNVWTGYWPVGHPTASSEDTGVSRSLRAAVQIQ